MVDTGLGHRFDGLAGIGLEVEEMNHLTLSPAFGWPVGGAVAVVLLACAIAQIVLLTTSFQNLTTVFLHGSTGGLVRCLFCIW